MKTTLYYFTGTGNSLKVAKDLAQYLENVELIRICQGQIKEQLHTDADIVGFVVPTIFSGIPKLVNEFIHKLKITSASPYIFAIATHGDRNGMGIVFEQLEKLLIEKELYLSACFNIQMPHNTPEKDHVTTDQEKYNLFKAENDSISVIAENIQNRKLSKHHVNKIKSFFERILCNSVYKSMEKTPFDKGFNVNEKCINCTICSKVCPSNNIEMVNNKPKWKLENCQYCFACIQWCPATAIQYKKKTIGIQRYHHPEIKANELFQK